MSQAILHSQEAPLFEAVAGTPHMAPADQPGSVAEISGRLFAAYTIDGGSVRLAGCTLEDRLMLGLQFRQRTAGNSGAGQLLDLYVDSEGKLVSEELWRALGMDCLVEHPRPPRLTLDDLAPLFQAGRNQAESLLDPADGPVELVRSTPIWCKHVSGRLRFTLGDQIADLDLAGWARTLQAPPFVCPNTGTASMQVAATDDGRITVAEELERCAETGQRLLRRELGTCAATGKQLLPEFLAECPVSSQRVERALLLACEECRQLVSPLITDEGRCLACRKRQEATKSDPRMERIFGEFPRLERWRNWMISESATVYNLTASGWIKRLLVVIDKETLAIVYLATATRFSTVWQAVEPNRFEQELA